MTTDRRNTDPDAELREAVRRYVNAKETPGVPCQRQYHEMRHACRRAMDRHGELEAQGCQ